MQLPTCPPSAQMWFQQIYRLLQKNLQLISRLKKAIMGVFDEGCMGMYNAIIPDELLMPLGVFKERLSQSALLAAMNEVSDADAEAIFEWLVNEGFQFKFGDDPATELTKDQVLNQAKMYVAACRIGDAQACDAIWHSIPARTERYVLCF